MSDTLTQIDLIGPKGILYISYDGMLEPLGQSQVLAYLKRLAVGRRDSSDQFREAGRLGQRGGARAYCARHRGCGHRLAPAALSQVAVGAGHGVGHCLRHCRGPVAGAAPPAAALSMRAAM